MCIMTRMTFLLTFRIVNCFKSVVQIDVMGKPKAEQIKTKQEKQARAGQYHKGAQLYRFSCTTPPPLL